MEEKNRINNRPLNLLPFWLLAIGVGIVGGLGAVVFRGLIAFFHNLFFMGKLSLFYNANVHTPSGPWGPMVVLVPVLGALGVAFLVKNFAPEAKGHGVPEVMDAIYYNSGIIRPVVAAVKSLASALSIGSGGAVGREGPIIQIGSSFGSTIGQVLKISIWQRITLIAAGAGAGIAATFNTPVGGVLFAVEIMMHEVSVRTLVPVAISTATATYIGRIAFGPNPSFVIPAFEIPYFHLTNPVVLIFYVGLGLIMGVVSAVFIKSIYGFEDFFEKRIKGNYYTRHMLGMFLVGLMMYLSMIVFGHYYIQGVGYATIQDILTGSQSQFYLLLLLAVAKLVATSLTLGSGASGGIFSPALFMGATLGGSYGTLLRRLFSGLAISPPAFAVAGMAGLVGGATGAAMAAIVMIFELTLDYNVIIPMTITVVISYGVRQMISKESIYTSKLVRRGHSMPDALQANVLLVKKAKNLMDKRFITVPASSTVETFAQTVLNRTSIPNFLVGDNKRILGVITRDDALSAVGKSMKQTTIAELANKHYLMIRENTPVFKIIALMRSNQASIALVLSNGEAVSADQVQGLITKENISDSLVEVGGLFSD